jgi:hypothetical protein
MNTKKAVKTTLKGLAALEAPAALKRAKAALANAPVTVKELKRIANAAADRATAEAPAKQARRELKAAMKDSKRRDKVARRTGVYMAQKAAVDKDGLVLAPAAPRPWLGDLEPFADEPKKDSA